MTAIGFEVGTQKPVDSKDMRLGVEDIARYISKETRSFEEFESSLIKEIRTVKDMENNLKHINIQVLAMKKLMSIREDIFRKIVDERNKGSAMDTKMCLSLFESIGDINKQLGSNLSLAHAEISKLFIDERQMMYLESEHSRELMHDISDSAKKLNTEIIIISKYSSSLDETLQSILTEINIIAKEREQRKAQIV
jgi:hypothetical protein